MHREVAVGVTAGLLVMVGVTGLLLSLVRVPAGVAIGVEHGTLVVRPRGLDVLWTFRRQVSVPLAAIGAVRAVAAAEAPPRGLRLPGSWVPRVLVAGSFGTGEERDFWDVRRADRLLVIACLPGCEYRYLVLEVPDPDAVAGRLRTTLGARR